MTPTRSTRINGALVEEHYWNGRFVVYVNNRLTTDSSYSEACKRLEDDRHTEQPTDGSGQ